MKFKFVFIFFLAGWFIIQVIQNLHLSDLDIHNLNTRRSFYPPKLAKLFQNKPLLILDHSQKAFFKSLPWP